MTTGYPTNVLAIDNGGGSLKLGIAGCDAPLRTFPNCLAKPKGERQAAAGDALNALQEISQLSVKRPFDRGYLVNWELERDIWSRCLRTESLQSSQIQIQDCGLALTEPFFNFPQIQAATEQVVFEEFGFQSLYAAPAPVFSIRRALDLQTLGAAAAEDDEPETATADVSSAFGSYLFPEDTSYHIVDPIKLAELGSDGAELDDSFPHSGDRHPPSGTKAGAGVVIDAGFSFTHIVPFFDGHVISGGVRRINVGGRAMTNLLKELVSFRALDVQDEHVLMDYVKERVCFVSADSDRDLLLASAGRAASHRFRLDYVLPDGVRSFRGSLRLPGKGEGAVRQQTAIRLREELTALPPEERRGPAGLRIQEQIQELARAAAQEQVLRLGSERFMVPEFLFRPSDMGMQQQGLAEGVMESVLACHAAIQPLLLSNVIVTGGVAKCPGFGSRLIRELRSLAPADYPVALWRGPDPVLTAWEGLSHFSASFEYRQLALTKQQYEERGAATYGY
uniref:Uncharacterized protein n=1 Tax=Polytomella parva TaxID=51329 RepID=A0A7S0UQK4_9CHLO|mmetsp:Transcript_17854/g.32598  ORF Transcript_17854/g.32598 Transcript_17854/m.32598 type:complete len:507 (+) Transcript_17854:91-1611(+)|eukprot:CAMPEP_0175040464 /NCGR_PEP_ID=MMETSP0052_2-20121109/1280_1 /TAXON_ID=51329 ORGANISM="Polytomella parva, Strain SAG 63-3" /NCGR_SAMPLE_ID=MMETSP0052_2 /ASSEMBLY_ACC=CAM_ASM_000194 /LENGTH=506 /DNA_ID=CAMNT_0016302683 /DNA_START=21 /DNA_END=1541 /DNA_ORIENTATION=-